MMRVPLLRPQIESETPPRDSVYLSSARIECRAVDTSCNPYLSAAMMLAAGLEGIEQELDPGDPMYDNMYELGDEELAQRNVKLLPRTLLESIEAFAADRLGFEVMGEELARSFIELKTQEWWNYHNTVSTWELDNYLTKY